MVDTINDVVNEAVETNDESGIKTLFDIEDAVDQQELVSKEQSSNVPVKELSEQSEWYYDERIKGNGMPPEWFNRGTFKNITEQARAYNEARKQITEYSEKLKAFSGAPEQYEEEGSDKDNIFAVGLKELGKKIGLNQTGFKELLNTYTKTKEIEAEKEQGELLQRQKEELKKIGGVGKLRELETKFIDAFGDSTVGWLKNSVKSYDDYANLENIVSCVSGKTRLPVSSTESAISTREQAEELIRDPRWGKDKEFTKKADKLLDYMLKNGQGSQL
ncbi:hypothetical protein GAMM_240003 [Gammaproteobacteria bacterium]